MEEEHGRQIEAERDIVVDSELNHLLQGLDAAGDEEAGEVNDFCVFQAIHILVEVRDLVLASSGEVGAESSLFVSDDDGAGSSWSLWVFVESSINSGISEVILQSFTLLIVSNGSKVGDSAGQSLLGQEKVCSSCRVESRSSWDSLSALHVPQLIVDRELLLPSKTGLSVLEVVFLEDCIVLDVDRNIKEWISNDEELLIHQVYYY